MKLISNKYLLVLLLVILVLVSIVSYMTYNVIIAKPITKTPEEIIDSLRVELDYRDSVISSLNDRLNNKNRIVHLPSLQESKVIPNSNVSSTDVIVEKSGKTSSQKEQLKSASETPVFVGF